MEKEDFKNDELGSDSEKDEISLPSWKLGVEYLKDLLEKNDVISTPTCNKESLLTQNSTNNVDCSLVKKKDAEVQKADGNRVSTSTKSKNSSAVRTSPLASETSSNCQSINAHVQSIKKALEEDTQESSQKINYGDGHSDLSNAERFHGFPKTGKASSMKFDRFNINSISSTKKDCGLKGQSGLNNFNRSLQTSPQGFTPARENGSNIPAYYLGDPNQQEKQVMAHSPGVHYQHHHNVAVNRPKPPYYSPNMGQSVCFQGYSLTPDMIPSYRNVEPTPYKLVPMEYDAYYNQVKVPTAEMIAQQERTQFLKQVSRDTQDEFGVNHQGMTLTNHHSQSNNFDNDFNNYQLYEESPEEANINNNKTSSGQYANFMENTNHGVDNLPQFYGPQMTMSQIPTEKPQPPPSFDFNNFNMKSQEFQDFLYRYYIWNEF